MHDREMKEYGEGPISLSCCHAEPCEASGETVAGLCDCAALRMSILNLLVTRTILAGFNESDGVFPGGPDFGVVLFFQ